MRRNQSPPCTILRHLRINFFFIDSLDFMVRKLWPETSGLNYFVICAGHGASNQQFAHIALICRSQALVCVYLIIGRYRNIIFLIDTPNVIIQIMHNNVLCCIEEKVLVFHSIIWLRGNNCPYFSIFLKLLYSIKCLKERERGRERGRIYNIYKNIG